MSAGTATVTQDPNLTTPTYAIAVYERGSLAQRTVNFLVNGVATDPTAVSLSYVRGDGYSATVTYPSAGIAKSSTGVYVWTVDTTPANGEWRLRWVATGACQASVEDTFIVSSL